MNSLQAGGRQTKESIVRSLIDRSSEFATKACEELSIGRDHQFCVSAAIGIELLGKAVLSNLSPALIAAGGFDSLLVLLGFNQYVRKSQVKVRTVGGREVLDRCTRVLPRLSPMRKHLDTMIDVRDGIIHYDAILAEETSELASAFYAYLQAAASVLEVGVRKLVRDKDYVKLLEEQADKSKSKVERIVATKIVAAKKRFQDRFGKMPEDEVAKLWRYYRPKRLVAVDEDVPYECPACGMEGELACAKELGPIQIDEEVGAWREVELYPDSFTCRFCELELDGQDEVTAAGMPDWIEGEPEEPDEEPEYYTDY